MDFRTKLGSNFLKASDIDGSKVYQVSKLLLERLGRGEEAESKYVIYFQDEPKGLVLNRTNSQTLIDVLGPETDDWKGQSIEAYTTTVFFNGQSVPCIRLRKAGQAVPF